MEAAAVFACPAGGYAVTHRCVPRLSVPLFLRFCSIARCVPRHHAHQGLRTARVAMLGRPLDRKDDQGSLSADARHALGAALALAERGPRP